MKLVCFFCIALLSERAKATVVWHIPSNPISIIEGESSQTPIDVDENGSVDFQFGGTSISGSAFRTERANRYLALPANPPNLGGNPFPIQDNTVIRGNAPDGLAWLSTDLDGFVDPTESSGTFTILVLCVSTGCEGPFYTGLGSAIRGAIGFEFEAEDGLHYGYFDVEFPPSSTGGIIHGWAYEDEPNAPISVVFIPEPSSSILLLTSFFTAILTRKRK